MPAAEATRSVCGGLRRAARVVARALVERTRLSRISRLNAGVQRWAATFAPERWMAAETSPRASRLGIAGSAAGFHWNSAGEVGGRRTSVRIGLFREARASLRADPSIPEAPERIILRSLLAVLGVSCMALMLFSVPFGGGSLRQKKRGNPNPRASRTFHRMDFLFLLMKEIAVGCPEI